MNKAVLLDRDGTIMRDVNYCRRVEDVELLPGAASGLKLLSDAGFILAIITNQSGVARG
ncbi:MAG: HAD-IIIA family hydrolase [Chloroflexota bacterium]